jgi:purine-binding chemotaxis protein CheW
MDFLEIRRKAKERAARAAGAAAPSAPVTPPLTPLVTEPATPPVTSAGTPQGRRSPPPSPPEPAAPPAPFPTRAAPGSPEARRLEAELGSRVAGLPPAPDARFVTWRPDGGPLPELAAIGPPEGEYRALPPEPAGPAAPLDPLDDFFYRADEAAPEFGALAVVVEGRDLATPQALEEYLTFRLGGETYGVEIGRVLEVLRTPPITEVPRAPRDVLGVISVRGDVITLVDPRGPLGLARADGPPPRRVLIVDDGQGTCGLLIDLVAGVVRLPHGALEPCPQSMGGAGGDLFRGIGRERDRLFMVLDLEALLRPLRRAAEARTR